MGSPSTCLPPLSTLNSRPGSLRMTTATCPPRHRWRLFSPVRLLVTAALLPLKEAPTLSQLESLFLYILNALRRQISQCSEEELDEWKRQIKECLPIEGVTESSSSTLQITPVRTKLRHNLSAVVEETESFNDQRLSTCYGSRHQLVSPKPLSFRPDSPCSSEVTSG